MQIYVIFNCNGQEHYDRWNAATPWFMRVLHAVSTEAGLRQELLVNTNYLYLGVYLFKWLNYCIQFTEQTGIITAITLKVLMSMTSHFENIVRNTVYAHHCPALKQKSGWTDILRRFTVSDSFIMPHIRAGYRACGVIRYTQNTLYWARQTDRD